jgi:integrase
VVRDLNNRSITIRRTFAREGLKERTKGKFEKPRYINPEGVSLLQSLCEDKLPEAFLFVNPRMGKPYNKNTLWRTWKKARKNIDVTLYQGTRHSFSSNAVRRGVPLRSLQDYLGHADFRSTLNYAHADLESQKVIFKDRGKVVIVPNVSPEEK